MSGVILLGGIILGLAVLVNFLFIVNKLQKQRYVDAAVDVGVMMAASSIYGMSLMGGISATFGSMFISIYLHYRPLDLIPDIKPAEATNNTDKRKAALHKIADTIDSLFTD